MTERHISLPRPENVEVAANFVPEGDEEVAKDEIQSTSKKSKDRTSPPTRETWHCLRKLGEAEGPQRWRQPCRHNTRAPLSLSQQVAVVRHALVFGRPFLRAKSMLRRPVFACFTLQGFDRHAHKFSLAGQVQREARQTEELHGDVARVCRGAVSQRCLAPRSPRRLVCS